MKKSVFLSLSLAFLLAIAFIKAEPVLILQQSKFQPGETLIGEIRVEAGEFAGEIPESNIKFSEGRRDAFFDYDLIKYNNSYYLYVYLTKSGTFKLTITGVLYKDAEDLLKSYTIEKTLDVYENQEIIQEAINQAGNITYINKTYTKILSIRPGVIFSSKSNSEIILENKGNKAFNITYGLDKIDKNSKIKTLSPNRPEKIFLNVSNQLTNFIIEAYSTFSVPIIYTGITIANQTPAAKTNKTSLKADHLLFQIKAKQKQQVQDKLELFNFANLSIFDLDIKKTLEVITIKDYKKQISPGGSLIINLSFYSDSQGFFKDNLTITFKEGDVQGLIIIQVEVYVFSENTSLANVNITPIAGSPTCAQKGGVSCMGKCSGNIDFASDGPCCIGGECTGASTGNSSSSGSSLKWIIGILILVGLGAGGYFLYKKVKSTKPKPIESIMAEKTQSFEKRVSGGLARG